MIHKHQDRTISGDKETDIKSIRTKDNCDRSKIYTRSKDNTSVLFDAIRNPANSHFTTVEPFTLKSCTLLQVILQLHIKEYLDRNDKG